MKVLVIEDRANLRQEWENFFKKFSSELPQNVEVEIPEAFSSLQEMSRKIFETLLSGGFAILDNDLSGFGEGFGSCGAKIYSGLCDMGFWKCVAMSSNESISHAFNIPKGGRLAEVNCLLRLGVVKTKHGFRCDD